VPWTGKAVDVWAFSSRGRRDGYNLSYWLVVVERPFARSVARARMMIHEWELDHPALSVATCCGPWSRCVAFVVTLRGKLV